MRNRVVEFVFANPMQQTDLKEVQPCAPCMCQWISEGACSWDSARGACGVPPVPASSSAPPDSFACRVNAVVGLGECLAALRATDSTSKALLEDLEQLGAVHVAELTASNWETLSVWGALLPLQRRRLLQSAGCQMAG